MDNGNSWDPGLQPELYFELMSDYDKEFLSKYNMKTPAEFFRPAPPNQPYYAAWQIDLNPFPDIQDINTHMTDIQARDLPRAIMAPAGEFDSVWDAFVAELDNAGVKEFEEFMQKIILELNDKLS